MQAMTTDAIQTSNVERTGASGMNWFGLTLFALLMIYPFVVNFIPQGIRAYLSTSLR